MNHGRVLAAAKEDQDASEDFPLPGKVTVTAITVTAIDGEQGYTVAPDRCTLNIDIRTTHLRGHCGRRAAEPHHRPGRQTLARHPAHPRGSEQVLIEDGTKLWH